MTATKKEVKKKGLVDVGALVHVDGNQRKGTTPKSKGTDGDCQATLP